MKRFLKTHKDGFEYVYSQEAKCKYTEFANSLSEKMNLQWQEESICTDNFSKDNKISSGITLSIYTGTKILQSKAFYIA